MKLRARITGLPSIRENAELIERLVQIYPEGAQYNSFFMDLVESDQRAVEIFRELERFGFRAWKQNQSQRDRASEYFLDYYREYEASDFDNIDLVRSAPQVQLACKTQRGRDHEGRIGIEFHEPGLPPESIATDGHGACLVRDRVRRIIEEIRPQHLFFRETVLVTWWTKVAHPIAWQEFGEEPWWEVTSDLTLPPLAPSMVVIHHKTGKRLPRGVGAKVICFARDPDEPRDGEAQFHYCRSEIEASERFDAALTLEKLGSSCQLVLSRRVYRALLDANIENRWIPCPLDAC